ncbi:MAG: 2-oxoacid:acceptor oxidoreductase subunit alpha [Bacillota bacterium]|nr:2-oxoacid:acceptor oxidoreductase subunit alpha [Bacillota bacterium]
MEVNILIGGAAGQGMETVMNLLGKTLVREGYRIIYSKDYMSRVRGGHNFSRLRIASDTPWTTIDSVDILVALNEETYASHREKVSPSGRIIYDPGLFQLPSAEDRGVPVKLEELAKKAGGAIMINTVAVGALLVLLGLQTDRAKKLLEEVFSGKEEKVVEENIRSLQSGYEAAGQICRACFDMPTRMEGKERLFIDGNQVLGMSALAGGCRFMSAYPMTPSTGIMNYLAAKSAEQDIVVEQAEDEIAAINMALGASYAGIRALTATSGGGFSLMVEGFSLAGMTETPLVIIVAMRPGPATGLPTRTEQGDLGFVIHAGHGEFPRAVLSATSHEDAFYRLNKAFELADKYQTPVIFLSDQNFADTHRSVEPFDFSRLGYDRALAGEGEFASPYLRYRFTENGISPRIVPGRHPGEVVLADSDEHDEKGNIIEDSSTRIRMAGKRMQKLTALAEEMDEPDLYGDTKPERLIIGWGSTYGVLREAVDALSAAGPNTAMLHFSDIWPLPKKRLKDLLPSVQKTYCVENNAGGQLAALIRQETGHTIDRLILKYDGRPFMPHEIVEEVEKDGRN